MLERRRDDTEFREDPFKLYGGTALNTLSHGESFLAVVKNRFSKGLFLMDEPESALSPQRQLALMAMMHDLCRKGSQFIVATHSPILMTFPTCQIVSFDDPELPTVTKEQTSHFSLTRDVLNQPDLFALRLFEREEK